jgi:hypothetical protein
MKTEGSAHLSATVSTDDHHLGGHEGHNGAFLGVEYTVSLAHAGRPFLGTLEYHLGILQEQQQQVRMGQVVAAETVRSFLQPWHVKQVVLSLAVRDMISKQVLLSSRWHVTSQQ